MTLPSKVDELADGLLRLEKNHGQFALHCTFCEATIIVSQMQLALRHPKNVGESSIIAKRIVEDVIDTLASREPRVGELLRLGFDRRHDVREAP